MENRTSQRSLADLKAIILLRGRDDATSKEIIEISTVSKNGAGFTMSNKCTPGHLVSMVLPMPDELRVYAHGEKLYPIIGLVQHCTPILIEGETKYQVGVGFIGREAPESYKADPNQSYRISGMNQDGLWSVTEGKQFKPRKNPRFWMSLKVSLSLIQKDIRSISKEDAITQNISASGVAVISDLDAKAGDRVKFACKDVGFYSMATVKDRRIGEDGEPSTLHLEFLDDLFPMDKIFQSRSKDGASHRPPGSLPGGLSVDVRL